MSIDLDKNKASLLQVYNDVLDDKTSTDWALFGYEAHSNTLKVVGSGDEGLEEMTEELNASKIMYGILKLLDPKTSRNKVILLNWQGEGAPNLRKGICSRHLHDVKRFFKAFHITFTARTEDDVDSEMILNAISKATSTEYNFKDRSDIPDKTVPVKKLAKQFWTGDVDGAMGTNYKRTNPVAEIDANRRNKFWEEQEAEERMRKEQEIQKKEEEAKRLERERMERELRDSKQREELNKERNARILSEKKAEQKATESSRKRDNLSWEREMVRQRTEEEERTRRADQMRMERKQEAESLIGQKTHHTRSLFESQSRSGGGEGISKAPSRKLREFNPCNVDQSVVSSPRDNATPRKSVGARWPPPSNEEPVTKSTSKAPGRISEWTPQSNASFSSYPKDETPLQVGGAIESSRWSPERGAAAVGGVDMVTTNVFQNTTSSYHTSSVSSTTANWDVSTSGASPSQPQSYSSIVSPTSPLTTSHEALQSPASPQQPKSPTFSPSFTTSSNTIIKENGADPLHQQTTTVTPPSSFLYSAASQQGGKADEGGRYPPTNGTMEEVDGPDDVTSPYGEEDMDALGSACMTYEVEGIEYQILPEHGLCARALYDYQAADDTEITFDPGDILTNIDQIDVGWWQGVSAMGVFGLFPANYVELINGSKIH